MRLTITHVRVCLSLLLLLAVAVSSCSPAPAPASPPPPKKAAPAPPVSVQGPPTAPTIGSQPTRTAIPTPVELGTRFPEEGRAIKVIIPVSPGDAIDRWARMVIPYVERELRSPLRVVNMPEEGGQLGLKELLWSEPDGYTLAVTTLPRTVVEYLDPERGASFRRASFQPIATTTFAPTVMVVKPNSPHRNLRDLVVAAKENPRGVKASAAGLLSTSHLALLQLQRVAGAEFSVVQVGDPAAQLAGVLAGQAEVAFLQNPIEFAQRLRQGGDLRVLALLDEHHSSLFPFQAAGEQGYRVISEDVVAWSVPADTPLVVAGTISGAFRRAVTSDVLAKRAEELGIPLRFMDPEQAFAYWGRIESQMRELVPLARN